MSIDTLVFLHTRLAQTTWLFMLIMGLWALAYYVRNRALDGSFLGIVVVGEILLIMQGAVGGIILAFSQFRPARPLMHFLYGAFALCFLPAIYYYTRGEQDRRAALIWFFSGIFMFGMALRLISTATSG